MNLIDIHCHPSLKLWLFNRHIYNEQQPHDLNFSEKMFVNLPAMEQGGVTAAVAVHHLPEAELETDAMKAFLSRELLSVLLLLVRRKIKEVIEDTSFPTQPFEQIKNCLAKFEADVEGANQIGYRTSIARNFAQFQQFISEGKTVFLHSIEGLHCLGTKQISQDTAASHLRHLFEQGVCQITPAHFFENVLVSSQGGIAPRLKRFLHYDPGTTYTHGYNEADDFAIHMIDLILELGMVIDLVHCHVGAKQMVYERNNGRAKGKRPLVFSHTGIREIATGYNSAMPEGDQLYLPNREDIDQIKACGGVFGIIFMDYWLYGFEGTGPALDFIVETIFFIRDVCGNYDHVAIGSDLDGFTEVPRDLAGESYMKDLAKRLKDAGVNSVDLEKILFNNYLRVLKNGWGQPS